MPLPEKYDIIIAGLGASGLWTAYYLQQYHPELRVLLVDREKKIGNDHTWCFWGNVEDEVKNLVHYSWSSIVFRSLTETYDTTANCPVYHMVRSDHFYCQMDQLLSQNPNFKTLHGTIDRVSEDEQSAFILLDGQKIRAKLIFDSTFQIREWKAAQTKPYTFLWQHFLGWRIKTALPVFNPDQAVLMDFNTPQFGATRFFYVLPLSETEALIEYTIFSQQLLDKAAYTSAMKEYIQEQFGIDTYKILEEEKGKIPMTDGRFTKNDSSRIISIGTKGGYVKPTTGFAFIKIQQAAKQMIQGLDVKNWKIGALHPSSSRFFFYDQLLLHILAEHGQHGRSIFCALFQKNSMRRILTFLEERSSIFAETRIFASLPTLPFLQAIIPVLVRNLGLGSYRQYGIRKGESSVVS